MRFIFSVDLVLGGLLRSRGTRRVADGPYQLDRGGSIAGTSPSNGGRPSVVAAPVGYALLFCAVLTPSCAQMPAADASRSRFGVITSEGVTSVTVGGSAKGFTNTNLAGLIRAGLAEAYSIQCEAPQNMAAAGPQMVWHVTNIGVKPTAIISVYVVKDGKVVKSAYTNVAAPGANPNAVFMYDVLRLAQTVLQPNSRPPSLSQIGCS
jgi:hypothetical protein